jgi:preprotein translocase subunit Sec63
MIAPSGNGKKMECRKEHYVRYGIGWDGWSEAQSIIWVFSIPRQIANGQYRSWLIVLYVILMGLSILRKR